MTSTASSELSGPNELLTKLLDGRDAGRTAGSDSFGAISNDGVRRLVTLAYFASQSVEEGRYPRFRILVAPSQRPSSESDPWQIGRFAKEIPLQQVDDLRRLAPCAASHDFALEVEERSNRLVCVGIRLAHSGEGSIEALSTSLWARTVRNGLMIRVDGPGELRVSESQRAWDLRAGSLSDLGAVPTQPLPRWLAPLAKRLATKPRLESHVEKMVFFAWHELLHTSSEARRGGCFVVLPKAPIDHKSAQTDFEISLKFPIADMKFGKAIADFVAICKENRTPATVEEYRAAVNGWLNARHRLLSLVESVARLSGVDGCTVFDSDLNLVGFGGKIMVKTEGGRRLRDAVANKYVSSEALQRTGTRHLSAFRLCDAHEGVACYVVSQDGHVTAFWSHGKTVERWKPYPAWAKRSDQF